MAVSHVARQQRHTRCQEREHGTGYAAQYIFHNIWWMNVAARHGLSGIWYTRIRPVVNILESRHVVSLFWNVYCLDSYSSTVCLFVEQSQKSLSYGKMCYSLYYCYTMWGVHWKYIREKTQIQNEQTNIWFDANGIRRRFLAAWSGLISELIPNSECITARLANVRI